MGGTDLNAFFQIIDGDSETKLRLVPASGEGEPLNASELLDYLNFHKINFDLPAVNKVLQNLTTETVIILNKEPCYPISEDFFLDIKEDHMKAVVRFTPSSSNGSLMSSEAIIEDLKHRGVVYGVDTDVIEQFVKNRVYYTDIVVANGTEPIQGEDARIEYFFNTDAKARPTLLEDGSVDFFHLNIINHCEKGALLAKLHQAKQGENGSDIMGTRIKPRDVKRTTLKYGKNIDISEDKTELYARDNGHVTLVDGRVFVSTVMELENVDTSTGNVEFEGNVQINGNVCSNFKVFAKGNVEVRGVVEGAEIVAGGNITIARGMNGMGKGRLKAAGNIVSQFIENSYAEASGYVESGSILHSEVLAGTEVHVNGKRGFISGGHVSATSLVEVKILGSDMGTDTVIEIGVSPTTKKRYKELGELIEADEKVMGRAIPILEAARDKYQAGKTLSDEQIDNIRELAELVKVKRVELSDYYKEYEEIKELIGVEKAAQVIVQDTVYPGTKVVISDVSKIVKQSMKYCRFIKRQGDVAMVGM